MKNPLYRYAKYGLGILGAILALYALLMAGGELFRPAVVEAKITEETIFFDRANPQIQAVMAIQDRHTPDLMALSEVVGTATGLTEASRPAILVFTRDRMPPGLIPENLEDTPVVVKVTGEITAMPHKPGHSPSRGGGEQVDPTSRFARPVPIGVSTGNEGECSAGTIAARVKADNNVYALSNNHVYALENEAFIGSNVLQPGRFDTNCNVDPNDAIGTLADFEPIVFSTSASNTIDAAIALSSTGALGNATPAGGYGTPTKSLTVSATLGQAVQKYGRTTALTKGTITAINATVFVGYSSGTARFVDQIIVEAAKPVIKPGDSGSLLVTDPGRVPVGLLFAGNASGKLAVANRINLVLGEFGVTIDGD